MYVKKYGFLALIAALSLTYSVAAQSYSNQGRPPAQEDPFRQIRLALSDLKNNVRNHEVEIRTFEAKLQNQETSLETIRQQLADDVQQGKDFLRATTVNLEGKIVTLDNSIKGVVADLKQFHLQSNDTVSVLTQYKQKLGEFEQIVAAQNEQIKNLEAALKSIMEILQVKESVAKEISDVKNADGSSTYKVQPGDSLERIARAHKVSLKSLKEANSLTSDKINSGQILKIPQKTAS